MGTLNLPRLRYDVGDEDPFLPFDLSSPLYSSRKPLVFSMLKSSIVNPRHNTLLFQEVTEPEMSLPVYLNIFT